MNGLAVTNGYDADLRRTVLSMLASGSQLAAATYGYDNASRLASVTDLNNNSASYGYLANSPLVSQITFKQSSTARMTTTKQYDYLNRLTQISSAPSASFTSPLTFNYNYNPANQRTKDTLADGSYWIYGYDSLGQVTNACKFFADNTPVAGQQFNYTFDTIGNRTLAKAGGDATGANLRTVNYTNNTLNRVIGRDVPAYVDVMGASVLANAVTVNGQTAYRKEEYFRQQLPANNSSLALWTNIIVSGGLNVTGNVYVAKQPEVFTYDADGNLTGDGRFNFTWDGENRLINLTSLSGAPTGSKVKLDFTYDSKNHRIQKMVSTNNGTSYFPLYTNKFLYDGWNLVAETKPNNSLIRSYMWGSDLSGSIQGAGGVGGLLEVSYYGSSTTNCFPAFDGNGNVAALINAADGTIAANYEYSAFGEPIRVTGVMAKSNPFRFSTKYDDDESDLFYFGYRYYKPSTGTWPNRDPLGELGFETLRHPNLHLAQTMNLSRFLGVNLYCLLNNQPISAVDVLGLEKRVLAYLFIYKDSTASVGVDPLEDIKGVYKIVKTVYDDFEAAKGLIGTETGRRPSYMNVPDNYVDTFSDTYHLQSPSWNLSYPSSGIVDEYGNPGDFFNIDIIVHLYIQRKYSWHCPGFNNVPVCPACNRNAPVEIPPIPLP